MDPEIYEFGAFVLDVPERRLWKGDALVPLAPKARALLVTLVRHAGRLVTKRDLLELVWPDACVEEGILAVHVYGLRKALGDGRDGQRYIETVPREGYRFVAAVARRHARGVVWPMPWPIGTAPTQPAVYELIGRGRAHLSSASRAEIPKAVAAFQSAIAIDATYAAAHAGLALACCAQAELRVIPPGDAYREARTAALRALAMDAACADAQVALGAVLFLSDWNWTGARRSLQRALLLSPEHVDAFLLHGRLLEALGDVEGGLAAKQKALAREPRSALVHVQIAHAYWHQRRYREVIEWATRALDLDPHHLLAREYIAAAWWKQGDFDRHMEESLKHAASAGASADAIANLRQVYATRGRAGVIEHAIQHAQGVSPVQLALLYGERGLLDPAFEQLDVALARRDPSLVHLAVAPQWDSLRGDARFARRLARMGLE